MLRNQDYRFLYAHFSFAGFCENHDSLWKWTTMFGIFTGNHKDMVRCFWNNFFLFFFFANLAGIAWANSIIESVIGDEKDNGMRWRELELVSLNKRIVFHSRFLFNVDAIYTLYVDLSLHWALQQWLIRGVQGDINSNKYNQEHKSFDWSNPSSSVLLAIQELQETNKYFSVFLCLGNPCFFSLIFSS